MPKRSLMISLARASVAASLVALFRSWNGDSPGDWWPQALGLATGFILFDLIRLGLTRRRVSTR